LSKTLLSLSFHLLQTHFQKLFT